MCGIFGNMSMGGVDHGLVERMGSSLIHRGPDDRGGHSEGGAFIGHTRLSILDLETGHQPIFSEDGSLAIVFNGEIYNYKKLRKGLVSSGHCFKTASDTEVVLHLYEEYGERCLDLLKGMFAFAIWDSRKKTLFIARDRFGIKPVVYYEGPDRFSFASEIKALLLDGGVPRDLSWEALGYYLSFSYIPAPLTIYKGVKKLEPGSFLRVRQGPGNCPVVEKERWYTPGDNIDGLNMVGSIEEAKLFLKEALTNSVEGHMISDVPLGAFLSGGIDSSIIVGLMARLSAKPVKTFSIGYEDNKLFDETGYAREVAEFNSTEHHEFRLTSKDVLEVIPPVLDKMDEPFADWSIFPTYLVSRETRRHVKVALSGDGADEVFGGYRKYLGEYYYGFYSKLPGPIRHKVLEPAIHALPDSYSNRLAEYSRRAKKFVSGLDEVQARRHFGWMQIFSEDSIRRLLTGRAAPGEGAAPYGFIKDLYEESGGDEITRMLTVDIRCCLPYDMLAKVDSMSMLNSLEVRVPFLDHGVVEAALGMEGRLKLNGRKRKYVLVEAFKDMLPKSLHNRPKQGFDVPIGEWFKDDLRDVFLDVVNEREIKRAGIFDFGFIDELYTLHSSGRRDFSKELLNIFVFQWWLNNAKPVY